MDLDKPVTALKLGVAKKLWLWAHYPLIYTLVSMIYTMCIFCLNTYSIINLDTYHLIHPAIKVILIIIFTYDIITRIYTV